MSEALKIFKKSTLCLALELPKSVFDAHSKITYTMLEELEQTLARYKTAHENIQSLVDAQSEDEGIWFEAKTAPEAYLMAALRKLHARVEALNPERAGDKNFCSLSFSHHPHDQCDGIPFNDKKGNIFANTRPTGE